jgi:putative membrane protein
MGGMMGTSGTVGAWIILWILLAIAVGVTGGFLIARGLHTRRGAEPPLAPPTESPAVREAKDALRLRYANGEISREDYLQGKVELED